MTKRKRSKSNKSSGMSVELVGLILILIGIIGFGFGYIGSLIKLFGMFLMGSWWIVFVLYLLLVGLYMLFNRKNPKYFSSKLIGFYLIMIVILTASHFTFLNKIEAPADIIKITFEEFMDKMNSINLANSVLNSGDMSISIGGGLLGALSITCLYYLFGRTGTIIILSVLGVFGVIMLFDITISDIFSKIKTFIKNGQDEKGDKHESPELVDMPNLSEIADEVKETKNENEKIVITSLDDLKSKMNTEPEVKEVILPNSPIPQRYIFVYSIA